MFENLKISDESKEALYYVKWTAIILIALIILFFISWKIALGITLLTAILFIVFASVRYAIKAGDITPRNRKTCE